MPGDAESTKETFIEPVVPMFSTEIWPNWESWSSSRSRRSIRSLGVSPPVTERLMMSLRLASSLAICATSPPGSPALAGRARSAYCECDCCITVLSCWWAALKASVSRPLASTSAWREAASPPWALERSDQASQNSVSCWLMPESPGSASASSARSSACARDAQEPEFVFWPRNWRSRNPSRTRR